MGDIQISKFQIKQEKPSSAMSTLPKGACYLDHLPKLIIEIFLED